MSRALRILLVEDSEDDTQLILAELRQRGYEVTLERVETKPAMKDRLAHGSWDLILCDYTLPHFSAIGALQTLQEMELDLPFIVVSGTIGEESAVTILKAGAHDFILKRKLARLHPAIEREMHDARERQVHREVENERKSLLSRLDAINAEIERFTYIAFHDLRAPLITMKGFLGALETDLAANKLELVEKDIQRIAGAATKMDELLSDLLKLFRIGRVVRPLEQIDLNDLTREALETLAPLIRSKNVQVSVSSDLPMVHGDRLRLREVMENLIENGAMYTAETPVRWIEIGSRWESDEQVIFVRDNGQGIDPRYYNRIFNLFETLDPSSSGTGIGLTLAKRIVEVHGGRIWVESEGPGEGSTFYFTLPGIGVPRE